MPFYICRHEICLHPSTWSVIDQIFSTYVGGGGPIMGDLWALKGLIEEGIIISNPSSFNGKDLNCFCPSYYAWDIFLVLSYSFASCVL